MRKIVLFTYLNAKNSLFRNGVVHLFKYKSWNDQQKNMSQFLFDDFFNLIYSRNLFRFNKDFTFNFIK